MNAGQWALAAVVFWMGGTMILGGVAALVVLRITRIRAEQGPPPAARLDQLRAVVPASRTRAPSNRLPGWRPPPGA